MSNSTASSTKRNRPGAGTLLFGPLAAGIVVGLMTMKLLWHDMPVIFLPLVEGQFSDHVSRWLSGMVAFLSHGLIGAGRWHAYANWLQQIEPASLRWALYARVAFACICGGGAAILTFLIILRSRPNDKPRRGRALRQGVHARRMLAAEAAREWKGNGAGIKLHPDVTISQQRETKHLLVMGASGSGKSNIIWHVLKEAIGRKDQVLIFDSKGDFTSELKNFCLLAPWDKRSRAWAVAEDCPGPLDARELAARMIPDNDKDPVWPNASRAVLTTMIIHLQKTKPATWTFADLRQLLNLEIDDLRLLAEQHNPEALRSLEDGSKTTQSILINLNAFMSSVVDLAMAWGDPDIKRFSMRRWLLGNSTLPRTVVMQGHHQYGQTAAATINSLLSVMAATIASPSLADDPNRRIWLFLDEFAQLGKIRDIGTLIRMGRSKGLRIVIGAQDVAELRAIYDTHRVDAWTSSLTTSIYTRLEGGGTAEWVSRRIGDQESAEVVVSTTQTASGRSETRQSTIRKSPSVLASQLKSEVGARWDGVHAFIDGFDEAVYLVRYPYHQTTRLRPNVCLAPWVEPDRSMPEQPTAQAAGTPSPQNNDIVPQTMDLPVPGADADPPPAAARAVGSPSRNRRWARRSTDDHQGDAP